VSLSFNRLSSDLLKNEGESGERLDRKLQNSVFNAKKEEILLENYLDILILKACYNRTQRHFSSPKCKKIV